MACGGEKQTTGVSEWVVQNGHLAMGVLYGLVCLTLIYRIFTPHSHSEHSVHYNRKEGIFVDTYMTKAGKRPEET